ncbi:phage tail sheath family protein [Anabaena cylindrica FACHB-243]|uniref:Phage tail sheath protein fi-like protein n=1 Tax=Anabaena cylindrica (strain ATCC 27899 / PCC 7122) TaxID=272123 RepID=K9Z9G8_ANACC|nr:MULTISPECIES: phage tail sheath subtilisin-like domain-containing protein [Anabaena]AFZ55811.1 phage tail sheath protein fi-like protein [Anabaena cylindrica PCC 7122]MBD2421234.1 phage tail sheath family protein [Anabaena cylindrica FACHB-243]MBY5284151.1 phage tail sheath family protein [Anabaena sp. CCAP 1446/1C]MBY5308065.1 phage tail sheath family protein [Anabaena sp. CCAP 1446/1C]MCM2406565.1 phage tail sheath subtilisin-like domain-containing protein [Anabaena sp. CCAP 1446/1C]
MQTSTHLQLTAPGVYLQNIPSPPGKDLLTGVPVFLGLSQFNNAQKNGVSIPKMLTLWTQFVQYFGKPLTDSYLAHAVRGFFENGGRLCYVFSVPDNTLSGLQTGLQAIESLDAIDLVCAPDIMQNSPAEAMEMQRAVLEHCDRIGDRFAILDAFNIPNIEDIKTLKAQQQGLIGDHGALYAPWLQIENASCYIPPCGHIAGIYARNDSEVGVYRAPANYLLEGVLDLSLLFADADWQTLNSETSAGVNCIRSFRSRGIRIWGSRTLSQNPEWQYINIRRLKITVLRWVERNLADVIFEPNNTDLWNRIERELTVYCESLWEQGAIHGDSPEEAFYVKCNEETNPPEIRKTGQIVTKIGLAPTTPSEFIVISLVHGSSGVKFVES